MKVEQVTAYKSDSGRVFEHLEDAATDSLKTLVLNVFSIYSYSFDDDLPVVEEVVQNLMFKREELIKVLSFDVEKKPPAWQPIQTAPTDDLLLLYYEIADEPMVCIGHWCDGYSVEGFDQEDVGWWTMTSAHSSEKLDGHKAPKYWAEFVTEGLPHYE